MSRRRKAEQTGFAFPDHPPPCQHCKIKPCLRMDPNSEPQDDLFSFEHDRFHALCEKCLLEEKQHYTLKRLQAGHLNLDQLEAKHLPPGIYDKLLRPRKPAKEQPSLFSTVEFFHATPLGSTGRKDK